MWFRRGGASLYFRRSPAHGAKHDGLSNRRRENRITRSGPARRAPPSRASALERDVSDPDVVVVGSGPNGLAAAVALAQGGASVRVLEASHEIGGGMRTAELTLPGFAHDICAAVHPMGVLSPFFRTLPLEAHGLEWIRPRASVAHPMD